MTNGKSLLSGWRWWLLPAAISLILILLFVDPFIGDWDALEYTISALRGYPSSMALGRSLFIFYNHGLYVIAHSVFSLPPQRAYLLFKYAVVAQGPLTVIACWELTRHLTQSLYAATIAALLVTFSPVFVIYSGQVMTDVPALLLLTVALIIHLRGLYPVRYQLPDSSPAIAALISRGKRPVRYQLPDSSPAIAALISRGKRPVRYQLPDSSPAIAALISRGKRPVRYQLPDSSPAIAALISRGKRQRAWLVMFGAALLGMGVNLRESVGFFGPWLVFAPFVCGWRLNRRGLLLVVMSGVIFLVFALAPFGYWFFFDPSYRAAWYGWRESMRAESALHPISIHTVWPWLVFFLATSPLVLLTLPMAAVREWRHRKLSPLLMLAAVGLFANLLMLLNYGTAIGWRYLSTGLPALVPLTANYLVQSLTTRLGTARRAFIASVAAIALIAVCFGAYLWPLRSATMKVRAAAKEYDRELMKLPRDAVMISGAQTVAVMYWRGLGAGEWEVIGSGSGWPGPRIASVIESYLHQGRRVFLDADPRWWQPCGWHVREIRDLAGIDSHFHFRQVAPTVYEIRPTDDPSATDQPHLENLLPENRQEEVKRCFSAE